MKTLKNKIFSLIDSGSLLQIILFTSLIAIGGSVWAQTAVNPANGHTYELLKGCGTWVQCEAAAVQKGGHLVTIRSKAENDWITSTFNISSTPKSYWIGFTDQDVEGVWKWISGEPVVYQNWYPGRPDNRSNDGHSPQNYGQMYSNGLWDDTHFIEPCNNNQCVVDAIIELPGSIGQTVINPANGHTYELLKGCGTWVQCEAAAVQKGGHLVTIRSQAENDWILNTFRNSMSTSNGFWIGFTDQDIEGIWKWVSGEPATYTNWVTGEPSNYMACIKGENYAHMASGGVWNDFNFDDPCNDGYRLKDGMIELPGSVAVGTVSITKTLTGPAAAQVPAGTQFPIALTCGATVLNGNATTTTPAVFNNVPAGSCTVSETPPAVNGVTWGTPSYSPAMVNVTAGITTPVTVTNTANSESSLKLTVGFSGVGTGSITSKDGKIRCQKQMTDSNAGYGACTASDYQPGAQVTLEVNLYDGSYLSRWSGCDTVTGFKNSQCIVKIDAARTVTVELTKTQPLKVLEVGFKGTGTGKITSSDYRIDCTRKLAGPNTLNTTGDCQVTYPQGTEVKLTITADSGSSFKGWGLCNGDQTVNTCVITLYEGQRVEALLDGSPVVKADIGLDKITHDPKDQVADSFDIYLNQVTSKEQNLSNLCDDYFFMLDYSDRAEQIGCTNPKNGKMTVKFKIKEGALTFFEKSNISICKKGGEIACQRLDKVPPFSFHGTRFDVKVDAYSFKNGAWTEFFKGALDQKPCWINSRCDNPQLDHLEKIRKLTDAFIILGPKQVSSDIEKVFGYEPGTESLGGSTGGCYGMTLSSAAYFHNKNHPKVWGLSLSSSMKKEEIIELFEAHWQNIDWDSPNPYLKSVYSYKKNNLEDAFESLGKIMFYFFAQPEDDLQGSNNWFGTYLGGHQCQECIFRSKDEMLDFYKHAFREGHAEHLEYFIYDNNKVYDHNKDGEEATGHSILAVGLIEYQDHGIFIIYDNNTPDELVTVDFDQSNQEAPSLHKGNYTLKDFNTSLNDPLYIHGREFSPAKIRKSQRSILAVSDSSSLMTGQDNLSISYQYPNHIEVVIVGGELLAVVNSHDQQAVTLNAFDTPLNKDKAYLTDHLMYTKFYLPANGTYRIDLKKFAQYPVLNVYLKVPTADGRIEVINYNDIQTSKDGTISASLIVGNGNQDKMIKRQGASDVAPTYDESFSLVSQPVFSSEDAGRLGINAVINTALSFKVAVTGRPVPTLSLVAGGQLPPGVTFDPATGTFSGTPTTAGVYAGVLIATNSAGSSVINYRITVAATPTDIPTLSEWAMLILLSLLFGMSAWWMRRREVR